MPAAATVVAPQSLGPTGGIENESDGSLSLDLNSSSATGAALTDDQAAQVQRIKDANDIVDVVGSYVSLRPAGPTFKGLCPFHDDHRPSFDVDPRRQRYRCWACNKHGDVILFIQEMERVDFREALELLARRAGISLEKHSRNPQAGDRAVMLDLTRWCAEQFQQCLLNSPAAEAARKYLGDRHLTGDTIRRFGLGYAPDDWNWLGQRAAAAGKSDALLEKLGMIAQRDEGRGHFDRFRDRIIFPIRDARGQTVGFGGRVVPGSPNEARGPKYYNSAETPLFTKSEHLYGIDQALDAGRKAGYLAVVEGYTDVLMAHQMGIPQVVATLGTALNNRHVRNLRRFVPRVVLVFDADQGGSTGVDRALEVFVSQEAELQVATLPAGMDPCDLLVAQGPEPFRQTLDKAVDALEFKLNEVLTAQDGQEGAPPSVGARQQAVDALLKIIALAPSTTGQATAVKRELMVGRIARRLGLREETLWNRLREFQRLKASRERQRPESEVREGQPPEEEPSAGPAPEIEKQLLQVLLAEPDLMPAASAALQPADLTHPGLRRLLGEMYALKAEGEPVDVDRLRVRIDSPGLMETALRFQEVGRANSDRATWLRQILAEFRKRRVEPEKQRIQNQLQSADHTEAVELFRQLQKTDFSL